MHHAGAQWLTTAGPRASGGAFTAQPTQVTNPDAEFELGEYRILNFTERGGQVDAPQAWAAADLDLG